MRDVPRRVAWGAAVALILALLSIDPDPRGPLAAAADLWLAGHDAEAKAYFATGAAALRDGGVDPAPFELSFDVSPAAELSDEARAFALLDRLARDARAKLLYRTLWLARAGRREEARTSLEALREDSVAPRLRDLAERLGS